MIDRRHVVLSLPGDDDTHQSTRKSFRRSWNQLSRFQRNLILAIILALCLTFIVIVAKDSKREAPPKASHLRDDNIRMPTVGKLLEEESQLVQDNNVPPAETNRIDIVPQVVEPQSEEKDRLNPVVEENVLEQSVPTTSRVVVVEEGTSKAPQAMRFRGPANPRQEAVVEAFLHAWNSYKKHAWGHDNLKPISGGYSDWFGMGLTIIDSLDTMYIMKLDDEFAQARDWVDQNLTFETHQDVNLFEVTIRVLGGLLSAYHLSGDPMFLDKATNLGHRLMSAFNSPSGIPLSDVNLKTLKSHSPGWSPDSSTSEVTTIQLEFRDLARCTGENKFEEVIQIVNEKVHEQPKKDGLVPIFLNTNTGTFRASAAISLGARGDSYYEYLIKQWLQVGKPEGDNLITDYVTAIRGVQTHLMRTTPVEKHVYVGEMLAGNHFKPKMDHLVCYLPGTLLLGYKNGMPEDHLTLAEGLLETCYQMYVKRPTGLSPEITYFNVKDDAKEDMYVKTNDAHNLLRPEFVESLYYFYALTGDKKYQEMGWKVFMAFEKYTRVPGGGYTSIGSVLNAENTRPRDMMETFFLGETLKYFYLLFSDNRKEIDLEKFVFNSEAHPLPIRTH